MTEINWQKEVEARKDDFLEDLKGFFAFQVFAMIVKTEDAPFGPDVKRALDYMMELGKKTASQRKKLET